MSCSAQEEGLGWLFGCSRLRVLNLLELLKFLHNPKEDKGEVRKRYRILIV